jgi:hypothetical protein
MDVRAHEREVAVALQNRVDPFGVVRAASARGLFTGNRGVIHDPAAKRLLGRRWTTKAWIVCDLVHPQGVRREPMGRNAPSGAAGWTELFFLDEVTALAAGHRPCFYCRRAAADAFRRCFADGNALIGPSAPAIDAMLHAQRLATGATAPALDDGMIRDLPDGAMLAFGDRAFAMRGGALLPWSFDGYGDPPGASCRTLPGGARLVTPEATVAALRAGYRPVWHPTAPTG